MITRNCKSKEVIEQFVSNFVIQAKVVLAKVDFTKFDAKPVKFIDQDLSII